MPVSTCSSYAAAVDFRPFRDLMQTQVILVGNFKLLTAERGNTHQGFFVYENGWQNASRPGPDDPTHGDGYWEAPPTERCGKVAHGPCHGENCVYSPQYWNATSLQPCLFDLANDPQVRKPFSSLRSAHTERFSGPR
jgi:hypothetical protein